MTIVRELQANDNLEAVLSLCRGFFAEYESHHPCFFDTDNLTNADISGRFIDSLESDSATTLIAVVEDEIVGYASLSVREQPPFYRIKSIGAISALMVAKEQRRRGIGALLLNEAKNYFQSKGLKYFTFYTSVANRNAIRLYQKMGIEQLQLVLLGKT